MMTREQTLLRLHELSLKKTGDPLPEWMCGSNSWRGLTELCIAAIYHISNPSWPDPREYLKTLDDLRSLND